MSVALPPRNGGQNAVAPHGREQFERTMLALQDAREPEEVLAIVARAIAREFGRPCAAYDVRFGGLRAVGSPTLAEKGAPAFDGGLDFDDLRHRGVVRYGNDDLVAVAFDGQLTALFALRHAQSPLGEDERMRLRTIASHASLALSTARTFVALRRSAAESAALAEAARTMLGFSELEPLAEALCSLGIRLGLANRAAFYASRGQELAYVGGALAREFAAAYATLPHLLPLDGAAATAAVAAAVRREAFIARPVALGGGDDGAGRSGLFVLVRSGAFVRADERLCEALLSLAALALRNVELYEESVRANRALSESNAFKDDLMAMFAHDFKGPLTVISGFAELLLEADDDSARQTAQTILEQARRLSKLSEDALALAATESAGFSLQRTRTDVRELVHSAVAPLGRENRIALVGADEPQYALLDRTRMRHVIDNVIGNALKYSAGPVTVAVSGERDVVRIDVTDRGIGIPAEDLDRIFTRFGRAANARSLGVSGSGVGLYIAKKIVELQGGRLEVRSKENDGSTFSIVLRRL